MVLIFIGYDIYILILLFYPNNFLKTVYNLQSPSYPTILDRLKIEGVKLRTYFVAIFLVSPSWGN